MPDIGIESLKGYIPSGSSIANAGSSFLYWMVIIILIVMVAAIFIVIAVVIISRLKFNKKIVIYEKLNGRWEKKGKDRAMEIKYGSAGDTVFLLKKRKKYLPRPEEQTGRNEYWFGIRSDGEWINIGIEDIDFAQKKLKVRFVHPEMRYARTSLHKGIRDRYEKRGFMEKYGQMIQIGLNILFITIILVFLYLYLDKLGTVGPAAEKMVQATEQSTIRVLDKQDQILRSLDNICTNNNLADAT